MTTPPDFVSGEVLTAAQMNKVANFFWTADPIAQMQYEYDRAVDQIKEGRTGVEQYRALVERINRDVVEILRGGETADRLQAISLEVGATGPAETAKFFSDETLLWSRVIKEANIAPQ